MKIPFAIMLISVATMSFAGVASAATDEAKAGYNATTEHAVADYKLAREKCNSTTGNPKSVCVEEAGAARTRTTAEAEALYKNTTAARVSARIAIANADYDVAKAKCASQTGNDKNVCLTEAKAAKVAARADAKADKKVVAARTDARDDKREANYKVATEKCNAAAGPTKDSCIATAKVEYGK